jgi:hypothetical protein
VRVVSSFQKPSNSHNNYVLVPFVLIGIKVVLDAGVGVLVSAWKFDSFWRRSAITLDFNVEAVGEELWSSGHGIAMKGEQFSSKNVHARFDVARELEVINITRIDKLLISPQA